MNVPVSVTMRSDDGLSSRGDKALFLFLFLVGSALIVLQKAILQSVWVPMLTGAGLVLAYCFLALRIPRFRVREDRIGEGAYYLGFLFTLVSLSVALFEFQQGKSDADLISRFGLALATTICGIVCRVVLQQLRESADEPEAEVRESLSSSVMKLQSELHLSVELFTLLRKRIEQETAEAISGGMKQIIADNKTGLSQMVEGFQQQIGVALAGVSASIADTQATAVKSREVSARLLTAIEEMSDRIEKSQSPADVIRKDLDELAQIARKTIAAENKRLESHRLAVESLLETHKEIVSQAKASVETLKAGGVASVGLAEGIRESAGALGAMLGNLKGLLEVSGQAKTELADLVATTRKHVSESEASLLLVQRQVVDAAATIVREVGGR